MNVFRVLAVAALAVVVVSCCPCRKTKSSSQASLSGTKWQLIQIGSEAITPEGERYTINFMPDGKVNGMGDCNRFNSSYSSTSVKGINKFNIGMVASTRMFCPNQAREDQFFKSLNGSDQYYIDGDFLTVPSSDSSLPELVFEKRP